MAYRFGAVALVNTLYCRLFLGEYFLHGIGGGKYDEVTDALAQAFYGVEPPAYGVLTATLLLPLPHWPSTVETMNARPGACAISNLIPIVIWTNRLSARNQPSDSSGRSRPWCARIPF